MNAYRITNAAKQDFKTVLKATTEQFGTRQRQVYKELIAKGVTMVASEPRGVSSWDRGNVMPGLRAFHLERAADRRGAAAHTLYYAVEQLTDGSLQVVILRLLHESMEPILHIARASLAYPILAQEKQD